MMIGGWALGGKGLVDCERVNGPTARKQHRRVGVALDANYYTRLLICQSAFARTPYFRQVDLSCAWRKCHMLQARATESSSTPGSSSDLLSFLLTVPRQW